MVVTLPLHFDESVCKTQNLKKMKKITILFLCAVLVISVGCKKDFLDINTNPNAASNTTPELVLPTVLNVAVSRQITAYTFISGWMGQWAVSGSYAPSNNDFTTYKQTTDFGGGLWAGIYDNLEDITYVEQQGIAQKKPFYEGAAKIMKAYEFQQLVDMFNNAPYSEALKGTSSILPKYDNAQAIYDSLMLGLDAAIELMKRSDAVSTASSDILFSGNTNKWVKFANTLRLRILLRQSEKTDRASYIQSQLTKVKSEAFLDVDAGVNPGYVNTDGKMNPFYDFSYNSAGTYTQDFWRANQYAIQFYKDNNDPRLKLVYQGAQSDTSVYQGNYIGQQVGGYVGSSSSRFGPGVLKSYSQPAILVSAAESYFLQAEAALKGWIPGPADSLYKLGVIASFKYLGVASATSAAATYVSQSGNKNTNWAATTTAAEKLALIIRQKWAALNTVNPFEEWADYRRLHLPADIPLSQNPAVDVLAIPLRIIYPTSEYQTNAENVTAQGNINQHTSKIWWMP